MKILGGKLPEHLESVCIVAHCACGEIISFENTSEWPIKGAHEHKEARFCSRCGKQWGVYVAFAPVHEVPSDG